MNQHIKKFKIAVILGTRPEAIKLAPIILTLSKDNRFNTEVCVTAQHREMLDQVLRIFKIIPDCDLDLMQDNQTLTKLTISAIDGVSNYLNKRRPNMVIIQGDTTTTFSAALAAFYQNIPVAHIEAGLRTGNINSPWPEEANRILTSRLCSIHLAPTELNRENLLKEGITKDKIFVTGNTVIDALSIALEKINENRSNYRNYLKSLGIKKNLILVTIHRRENFGKRIDNVCTAINMISERAENVKIVFPVHLNPHVQEPVQRELSKSRHNNILLLKPLGYLKFIALMEKASLILTDSGGIQEEATALEKPVLLMRNRTERQEAVLAGNVKIVGTRPEAIVKGVMSLLKKKHENSIVDKDLFGDGRSSQRIINIIADYMRSINI